LWFHCNIYTMAEARHFKFGTLVGFANAHHKTTPRGKVGVALGWEAPIYLGFPFNISALPLSVSGAFCI